LVQVGNEPRVEVRAGPEIIQRCLGVFLWVLHILVNQLQDELKSIMEFHFGLDYESNRDVPKVVQLIFDLSSLLIQMLLVLLDVREGGDLGLETVDVHQVVQIWRLVIDV
jgi:hypothetical protein